MNPRVSGEFLDQERLLLGADFAREYEAEFTSGATSFLDAEELRDVVGGLRGVSPSEVTDAVVGFDPAFSSDPSAAVVVGARARTEGGSWSAGSSAGHRDARGALAVVRRRRPSARRSRISSSTASPRSRRSTARLSSPISTSRGSWRTGFGNEASSGW